MSLGITGDFPASNITQGVRIMLFTGGEIQRAISVGVWPEELEQVLRRTLVKMWHNW